MIHKGEILEKSVRASGMPISAVAKKMGKSRRWMYLLFENPNVSTDVILELGKILHDPFTELLPVHSSSTNFPPETLQNTKDARYWQEKYYKLLEEHLELIRKMNV